MKLTELFEMATPADAQRSRTYYHGTDTEEKGQGILKYGIQPGNIVLQRTSSKKPNLEPIHGKVYLTSDLGYAQIYAIGGDFAGHDSHDFRGYGYVFVIDGSELNDIQPDEDSVGEFVYYAARGERKEPILQKYVNIASKVMTIGQWKKFMDAEYVMWAHIGKKLLKNMPDEDKLAFIEAGAHVANTGTLQFKEAWRLDKSKIKDLKRDGSNFFDVAEKVK